MNKDGFIDEDELRKVMKRENVSEEELDEMIDEIDKNGDGRIEYAEFVKIFSMIETDDNSSICTFHSKRENLRAKFEEIDKNSDGFIDKEELRAKIKQEGEDLTEDKLRILISYGDDNGDGKIDFDEFVKMHSEITMDVTQMMERAFRTFDLDKNGFIDSEEFRKIMKTLDSDFSEEKFEKMMKECDSDGNGQIDYAEFIKVWNK